MTYVSIFFHNFSSGMSSNLVLCFLMAYVKITKTFSFKIKTNESIKKNLNLLDGI